VRLSYGRTQGFAITLKDISELSDIRERMNAANQRYRSLMEHVSCGICMLDVNGIILDLNQRMADIYGAVKKDVIGKYYLQYISPSDQAKSIERFKKINEFNDIYASEALITQPGGKVVEVEYSSICVNYENQKTIISVVNDVTERNKMRSQAILNGRLATIGTLSAGIIHEINNPLAWVNSNLNYLKRSLQNSLLPEDHRSKLAEVIDETLSGTDKMTEIIKDLKRFTRLDSAEGKTKISIVDALASAVKMAYPQFKNVATITTCYPEKIPDILAHFNKLHQVFLNLIVNAAQAFPEESEKNVISITAKAENNHIRIEFTDNGKGIAEDNLNKIFEPFFTTKPVGVGSGLGLSICRDIINQHGGEIDVVSELGKGTTFTVLLPVC
jgi:PAS domain S-box-containing protein